MRLCPEHNLELVKHEVRHPKTNALLGYCYDCPKMIEDSSCFYHEHGDECEICHGEKGGEPGNENIVDGKVMCDYCHAEYIKESANG